MQRNGDIQNQHNTDLPKVVTVKLRLFSASHVDRAIISYISYTERLN